MWESTYRGSQELPPEVLTDPKFASLAQAKAALDKDMQDGKVDNEKNVSTFLTEMMRFKTELKEVQQDSAVAQQLDMEGQLQKGREERGLAKPMEKEDYNFDGTPTTRSEYLRLSDVRRRDQLDDERARMLAAEQAATRKDIAGLNAQGRRDSLDDRDKARSSSALGSMVESSLRRYSKPDPETGEPRPDDQSLAKAFAENAEAIVKAARRNGVEFTLPGEGAALEGGDNSYVINGRVFNGDDPAEATEALKLLYQLSRT